MIGTSRTNARTIRHDHLMLVYDRAISSNESGELVDGLELDVRLVVTARTTDRKRDQSRAVVRVAV